jgi:hypothetical protein
VFLNRTALPGRMQIVQTRWMLMAPCIVACAFLLFLHGSAIWLRVISAAIGGLLATLAFEPAQGMNVPVKYASTVGSIATLLSIVVIIAFSTLGSAAMPIGPLTLAVPFVCGLILFVCIIVSDRMRTIVRESL